MDIEIEGSRERTKLILQLMWPALAENVLATLVSMADTMMVSSLGTTAGRAASGRRSRCNECNERHQKGRVRSGLSFFL